MLVSCEADTQGRLDERRVRICSTVVLKLQMLVYRHALVALPLLGLLSRVDGYKAGKTNGTYTEVKSRDTNLAINANSTRRSSIRCKRDRDWCLCTARSLCNLARTLSWSACASTSGSLLAKPTMRVVAAV